MADPTPAEEQLVIQFRNRLQDVLVTEEHHKTSFLIRWIRARDHDLTKAEDMLRSSLAWRKENKVDLLVQIPFDNFFLTEFPWEMIGTDKYGHPICVAKAKRWQFQKLNTPERMEQFKMYISYDFETICQSIRKANENRSPDLFPVTQYTKIVDWEGFSYMQMCSFKMIQFALHSGAVFEAHYPEIGFRCLCLNCPSYFNILMMVGKQVLAPKTYDKIYVYGRDKRIWENSLAEFIDENTLNTIIKYLS